MNLLSLAITILACASVMSVPLTRHLMLGAASGEVRDRRRRPTLTRLAVGVTKERNRAAARNAAIEVQILAFDRRLHENVDRNFGLGGAKFVSRHALIFSKEKK